MKSLGNLRKEEYKKKNWKCYGQSQKATSKLQYFQSVPKTIRHSLNGQEFQKNSELIDKYLGKEQKMPWTVITRHLMKICLLIYKKTLSVLKFSLTDMKHWILKSKC